MPAENDTPLVGIVMGSDSDLDVMKGAAQVLTEFGVAHELRIMSAHRPPDESHAWAAGAAARGTKVIIAGAGMAAHLAGAMAAATTLPVIGVPLASGPLQGADALFSTVQMPSGVPVATVAIGGAKNAAYLAVQILALSDARLADALTQHKHEMAESVKVKDAKLQSEPA